MIFIINDVHEHHFCRAALISIPKTCACPVVTSSRTLQRRLKGEQTSFREITDQLRKKISEMLLLHKEFTISDISFVPGYSESASFIYSFKNRHGIFPRRYRRKAGDRSD